MALTSVQLGALSVGKSLRNIGAGIKSAVKSASGLRAEALERSKYKILQKRKKIQAEQKEQEKIEERVRESLAAQSRENEIESQGKIKGFSSILKKNLIEKPMSFLMYLIRAWVVKNGPIILKEIRIFTKKLRVFGSVIKRVPGEAYKVASSAVNYAKVVTENLLNFNFKDRERKIEAARIKLENDFDSSKATFGEFVNVWNRDEQELDLMLEELSSDSTVKEAIEYMEENYVEDDNYEPASESASESVSPAFGRQPSPGLAPGAVAAPREIPVKMGFNEKQWNIYRNTVASIESGGKYNIAGGSGNHYDGRYQLGADAKKDAAKYLGEPYPGHNNQAREKFRQDPAMQERYFAAYTLANHEYLMRNPKYAQANEQRKLEILGYAHNQGMGAADKFLEDGKVGRDGFGTAGTKYSDAIARNFKNQDMSGGLSSDMVAQGDAAIAPPAQTQAPEAPSGSSSGMSDVLTAKQFNTMDYGSSSPIIKTSKRGMRGGRHHAGIDFGTGGQRGWMCAYNSNGTVTYVGTLSGYGKTVIIKFGNVELLFAHLASYGPGIRSGARYVSGTPIGEVGSTGAGTGIHLHFEARTVGGASGSDIDPNPYINGLTFGRKPRNRDRISSLKPSQSTKVASKLSTANSISSVQTGGTQTKTKLQIIKQKEFVLVG